MAETDRFEFRQSIVCDDIRREENGKDIIIGVYSGNIIVPMFPAPLALMYWLQFYASQAMDEMRLEFRVVGDNEIQFAAAKAGMRIGRAGMGSIAVGPFPIMLQIPTTIRLQTKIGDQDWRTINQTAVEKGQITVVHPIRPAGSPQFVAQDLGETTPA